MPVRPMGGALAGLFDADVLEQTPYGLYVVDRDRRIVYWNRAAAELTGFAAADVLGRPCHEESLLNHRSTLGQTLCGDDDCPVLRAMLTGASGTLPHLLLMGTRSGQPLPVSLGVGPLRGADGSVVGAIVLFRQEREEYQQRRLAMEIQKRIVTRGRIDRGRLRVHTLYQPVSEIGGDFIEAFFLDDGSLVATVADATGHGISAALFTMVYKTLLHATIGRLTEPARALEEINRSFMRSAGVDGFFLSACLARIEPAFPGRPSRWPATPRRCSSARPTTVAGPFAVRSGVGRPRSASTRPPCTRTSRSDCGPATCFSSPRTASSRPGDGTAAPSASRGWPDSFPGIGEEHRSSSSTPTCGGNAPSSSFPTTRARWRSRC